MSDRTEESDRPPVGLASSEQRLAGGRWLSFAAPSPDGARADWACWGATWLRPGGLFTAVTVSACLVHAAAGKPGPRECAPFLGSVLDGPVFYQERQFGPEGGYTVLLPASAAGIWRVRGTVVLPSHALVLVPAPDQCAPVADFPWWVVPLDGPGMLCTPALLASLLARGVVAAGARGGDRA